MGWEPLVVPPQFWRHPDVRAALRDREMGSFLRLVQKHTGASQGRLGSTFGRTQPEVSRYLKGRQRAVTLEVWEALADGLSMPDEARLALGLAPCSLAVVNGDESQLDNVVRMAHEWLVTEPPQVAHTRSGRRIAESLAQAIESRVDQLRRMDDYIGGIDLHEIVERELGTTVALLSDARYSEKTGKRVLIAVAELSQLAGWVAADAGLYSRAAKFYTDGLQAAREAEARDLGANLISSLSYQVANVGRPQDAVLLAETAYAGARDSASATTKALLKERIAWAHARSGDRSRTERALVDVDETFCDSNPEEDPRWTYWLDRDEIDVMAGRCFTELRLPAKAEPILRWVLDRYDESRVREAALYTSWLAESHIYAEDIELAAITATQAVTRAARTNSVRSNDRIALLQRKLAPHRDVAAVREFDEAVRSVAADR
jgi:hypothetical protein